MKITDIKTYVFWLGFRNTCLVKIETDEGIYGWGESGLSGREKAVAGAVEHFREFLIGQSALNISAIWQEMYRSQYFEGGRVLAAAISAIDIALHDALGKKTGLPVYQLLGGKQRNKIPLYATSIAPLDERFIKEAEALYKDGWRTIRATTGEHGDSTKPTTYDINGAIAQAAECLTETRKRLGNDCLLGIDFHHRLSVAETAAFCNRMPAGTLDFIEEPIRAQSVQAYESLRKLVDVPFAVGEEFASKWDFLPFIEKGMTQYGRVDICNAGGFTESMKIAAHCETHYIDMMPHNPLSPICTAASIHYCAAIPNMATLELPPYSGDLSEYDRYFSNWPKVKGTFFEVTDEPGLGIDVNEDAIKDLSFKFWEAPRLYKADGSYTNW